MEQKKHHLKIIIILLSLCVHIFLFILFFLPQPPAFSIGDSMTLFEKTLQQPAQSPELPQQIDAIQPPQEEWAELKAQASQFGAPVEFIEINDQLSSEATDGDEAEAEQPEQSVAQEPSSEA